MVLLFRLLSRFCEYEIGEYAHLAAVIIYFFVALPKPVPNEVSDALRVMAWGRMGAEFFLLSSCRGVGGADVDSDVILGCDCVELPFESNAHGDVVTCSRGNSESILELEWVGVISLCGGSSSLIIDLVRLSNPDSS